MIRVLTFAGARDAVGASELSLSLETETTARSLLESLCRQYPNLAPHTNSLRIAINGTYAKWDERVSDGDEIALIPPVAGG